MLTFTNEVVFDDRKVNEEFFIDIGGFTYVYGTKVGFQEFKRGDNGRVLGVSLWAKTRKTLNPADLLPLNPNNR